MKYVPKPDDLLFVRPILFLLAAMRRSSLLLVALLLAPASALAQAPDSLVTARNADGTLRMRLNTDGGLLVGGAYDGDATGVGIPVEGQGMRMIWYPRKGAFRAGNVQSGIFTEVGLYRPTTGTEWDAVNVGNYSAAFGQTTRASGDYSFAAGYVSVASGESSVAMGENNQATGVGSVALGTLARARFPGSFVFGDHSTSDYLYAGVNHSANRRVSGGFRIYTSSNLSNGVTIQSGAAVSNWGQSNAVISTSIGAYLSTGGVWTNASDVRRKRDFVPVSGEDVLARLRSLPLSTWSYRVGPSGVRHMGPMAQDFRRAYGLGNDSTTIGTVDADGVALAAAQALEVRTRTQAEQIAALKAQNTTLQHRLEALEARSPVSAGVPWGVGLLALAGLVGGFLSGRRRASA